MEFSLFVFYNNNNNNNNHNIYYRSKHVAGDNKTDYFIVFVYKMCAGTISHVCIDSYAFLAQNV
jgi:hypothetical protein